MLYKPSFYARWFVKTPTKNNQWSKFHRDSATSSNLHSRLVEVHNRESIGFKYSPYGADFKNKL
ncbi:hypothetical protein [Francisella salimarina]|uniref:hypothetical protein n=1 Tax=Francisella salimarina TaxID=2599927 RepID=UPI003750201E